MLALAVKQALALQALALRDPALQAPALRALALRAPVLQAPALLMELPRKRKESAAQSGCPSQLFSQRFLVQPAMRESTKIQPLQPFVQLRAQHPNQPYESMICWRH